MPIRGSFFYCESGLLRGAFNSGAKVVIPGKKNAASIIEAAFRSS